MNPQLHTDVLKRLEADYEFVNRGDWLRKGRCPKCNKREMYAHADAPWVIRCGRLNNCGYDAHVKELYPDLFEAWSERFPRTEKSPTAAADAYLQYARGFDAGRLKGCYTQETYADRASGASTATVRFSLPGGGWWERLIDQPGRFGKKKANFAYGKSYAGQWWQPPGLDLATVDEVWICEGIFDAIALWLHGIAAVSAMSCNNYPEQALMDLARSRPGDRPKLVWALDAGTAGESYTRKWSSRARQQGWDVGAAHIPQRDTRKIDWNDLHQREQLTEKNRKEYRYHGDLLIARRASDKALLIYHHDGRVAFPFDFANRLYWFKLDLDAFAKAKEALANADKGFTDEEITEQALAECNAVSEICTAFPKALYFQRDETTDESWYYFRVQRPGDRPAVKNTFTGAQIMAASEFGKRLASIVSGALFTGNTGQLMALMKRQMRTLKEIKALDFVGYSKEHGVWVFGDIAVKDGKVYEINDEDYFEIGRLNIKTLLRSTKLKINPADGDYDNTWWSDLWAAFGTRGAIALTFWLGSLFAEQIRAQCESFPFLEVIGEAGAGKTTLIEFLWKLLGRDGYEGTDPTKSTLAGRARTYAQVANLPLVLIEADRSNGTDKAHTRQFDWDELKPLYNGTIGRSRGVKSAGNETYEPPFRGAVVISQNAVVDGSDATLQRIVHMAFTTAHHTPEGGAASKRLSTRDMSVVSGFALRATRKEKELLAAFSEYLPGYEAMLQAHPRLKSVRICKNHAQLMALADCLEMVVPIAPAQKSEVFNALLEMAIERQQAINADHPLVQEFWEAVEYLEASTGKESLNHSRDEALIAINLNHFTEIAARHGLTKLPSCTELRRLLPDCRKHKFVGRKAVNSAIFCSEIDNTARTVKCWVFERRSGA